VIFCGVTFFISICNVRKLMPPGSSPMNFSNRRASLTVISAALLLSLAFRLILLLNIVSSPGRLMPVTVDARAAS